MVILASMGKVRPHTRRDGTKVTGHERRSPQTGRRGTADTQHAAAEAAANADAADTRRAASAKRPMSDSVYRAALRHWDLMIGNSDCTAMNHDLNSTPDGQAARHAALNHHVAVNAGREPDRAVDWLGGPVPPTGVPASQPHAQPRSRGFLLAVDDDTATEMLEAVCVEASHAAVTAELRESGDPDQLGPSVDLACLRQALACVAAHPNASDRAVRQAVRVAGKSAAREVLRRRADPELVRFAFENSDVHAWDAVTDTAWDDAEWAVNPALPSDKLDSLIGMSTTPGFAYGGTAGNARLHAALLAHPNLTDRQRAHLERTPPC